MANTFFSRRNLDFTLFEVLKALELTQYPYYSAHDRETFGFSLDAAADIAEKWMWPTFMETDRHPPEMADGGVKVHPAVHQYFRAAVDSGLLAAPFPVEYGGQQLPKLLTGGIEYIFGSAHNSMVPFTDLSSGAANLLLTFGTEEQKQRYVQPILAGEWTGTMCLTEPGAGSGLSDVACSAEPQPDGSFHLKGTKIFITGGDHDLTDNIVHLVLARIKGAPKGTKGISLFVVPKNRLDAKGQSQSNDVQSVGLYHKMGQRTATAMHLDFGVNDDCRGELIGEAGQGLAYMFQMMNAARLNVGMAGVCVASAAYYVSLQYAHERKQGRRAGKPDTVLILEHPDVRRLLFQQKAFMEGTLSFILQCFKYLDLEKVAETEEARGDYNDLLELLTPVAKMFGSEYGFTSINQGLQVLGGYGFTEDFPLEQMVRDARIFSIYEGTTAIQGQAVLGRQVLRNQGKSLQLWLKEVEPDLLAAENFPSTAPYSTLLRSEIGHWKACTQHLTSIAAAGDSERFLADATLYIEAFGLLNVGWQWLRQGSVAQEALLHSPTLSAEERTFYESKLHTMTWFFHYELVKLKALFARLNDSTPLTLFSEEKEYLL